MDFCSTLKDTFSVTSVSWESIIPTRDNTSSCQIINDFCSPLTKLYYQRLENCKEQIAKCQASIFNDTINDSDASYLDLGKLSTIISNLSESESEDRRADLETLTRSYLNDNFSNVTSANNLDELSNDSSKNESTKKSVKFSMDNSSVEKKVGSFKCHKQMGRRKTRFQGRNAKATKCVDEKFVAEVFDSIQAEKDNPSVR